MAPFSSTRPNPVIPVGGEYMIEHAIGMLHKAGVSYVNMVVGHKSQFLKDRLNSAHHSGTTINFIDQGKPDGIGKAILCAKDNFTPGEHFILVYADTLTTSNIFSVTLQSFGLHKESTASICLPESSEKYGNVYLGQDMKITKLIEKPEKKKGLGNYVLAGVFVLSTSFFDYLEKSKGNMETALKKLIKNEGLRASIWEDAWLDMAYPWDILTANKMIMDKWKSAEIHNSVELKGATIKGPVRICEGARIEGGAVLEGPSYIGPGSYVGHSTLIRPYTCIGADSVVGQGSELKNCVMFPKTIVGRLSFIGDSVLGEGVDMGAGAMTINLNIDQKSVKVKLKNKTVDTGCAKLGAFIGDGAVIGAANILPAGAVLDSGAVIEHNYTDCSKK